MIDNSADVNHTAIMNNEHDNEIEIDVEAVNDSMFHVELSEVVASLPVSTVEQDVAYNVKMQLLDDIHNEVFPVNVNPEPEHSEGYDSRYYHEYSVGNY